MQPTPLLLLICLMFCLACQSSTTSKETTPIDKVTPPATFTLNEINEASIQPIMECAFISNIITKKDLTSSNSIAYGEHQIDLLKYSPDQIIPEFGNDPVGNVLVKNEGDVSFVIFPSLYDDDFEMLLNNAHMTLYNQYMSPAGFSKLIVFEKATGNLFESDRIMEVEEYISDSVNLSRLMIDVKQENGLIVKRNLVPLDWIACAD